MVTFAIPPVIILPMPHCTYRTPKPVFTTPELYLRRTARCCLSCYSYSLFKSFIYSASNVWVAVTGVEIQRGRMVPYLKAVEGTAKGYSC